jgi:hypothetical protein
MTAAVKPWAMCNSACVLIYAGAVVRFGHFNSGQIGIHQPYFEVPKDSVDSDIIKNAYANMLRDMRSYLHEMNVSEQLADEMLTVPLCRDHHQQLHHHGNEMAWWTNLQIAPMEAARELWAATLLPGEPASDHKTTEVAKRQPGKIDPANDAERACNDGAGAITQPPVSTRSDRPHRPIEFHPRARCARASPVWQAG